MDKTFKYEHSFVALVAVTKLINDHKSNQIYPLIGDIWSLKTVQRNQLQKYTVDS